MKRTLPSWRRAAIRRVASRRTEESIDARPALLRRVFSPSWESIVSGVTGQAGLRRERALEWELVLQARHVPCRLVRSGGQEPDQWAVQVQPWFLERALGEIRLYLQENQPVPEPLMLPPPRPGELWPTAFLMLCMLAFHAWWTSAHPGLNLFASRWLAAGSAKASAILDGEWWRLATALTLHADGPHVVGNVIIGGVFIVLACRVLGSGLAWLLVMASGIGGNFFNALVLGPPHDSIGFSTAVFGAAGVLAGVRVAEGRGHTQGKGLRRALVPVGAGLGILAMLGSGGENTDLGAHLFGFVAGVVMGLPGGLLALRRGRPGRVAGGVLLAVAVCLPVAAWVLALGG